VTVSKARAQGPARVSHRAHRQLVQVVGQLDAIEDRGGSGELELPDGARLEVSNLQKPFWRSLKVTKGELMRYYVQVSPFILPAVADRPLVMKRYPNGVEGQAFYQQRAPAAVPDGVRTEVVAADTGVPNRLIGGSLQTLLYTVQLAAISQDPWFSRVNSPDYPDFVAIDLDPMPGVKFEQVLDVARWIHDELEAVGALSVPKTSGASGLHIYLPLPPKTLYEAGLLFCQIIATLVAEKHPKAATVRRAVRARGGTVYIDYLQNIRGKTLATAYSARASDFAGASAPLSWREMDEGVDPRDFTIRTLPERLVAVGDLWAPLRTGRRVNLRAILGR
jgi:bifunctional non-homologous end joining protein LigD